MAVLSDADRALIAAQFMRENAEQIGALVKSDIRSVVDALDVYLNDNATAINTAIPATPRGILTVGQKARIFGLVVRKRYL